MRRDVARLAALANLVLLFLAGRPLSAATFTWIKNSGGNASGSWGIQADWSGGTLPTTTNDTVNFNMLDISTNSTVTLDGNRSASVLNFSDTNTSTAGSWIINAGSPSSSTVTLGGASPTINVTSLGSGKAAVINAVVAGTGGFTKTGASFLQLNGANTYSGGTIISGGNCCISAGNGNAFGTGTVTVGGTPGDGQIWFNTAGSLTLTNAFEIRTIRWIIDNTTVNGVAAGNLTVNGNVLLNTGSSNVRDIYCNINLTINGNVSVTPANNPMNKNGGYTLTLNGTNTVGGASAVNAGTLVVNGPMNGGAMFTVHSGTTLGGTGVFSGAISVASGGNLSVGNNGSGTLTCGGLTAVAGANWNYAFGATNNPANGFIKVSGNATLAGMLNITDLGGFSAGVYTGFQYSGSVTLAGLTNGVIPGGNSLFVDTNTPHCVLFHILNGVLNPAAGEDVPMDLASPMTLSWVQGPTAAAYDLYLGTSSNNVANATTNTVGIYQGRTAALTSPVGALTPNTTYYWRVDYVASNGTVTIGAVLSFTTGAPMVDLMEDTWVATDALGRVLPGNALCGLPRTNRYIGIMYEPWQDSNSIGSGAGGNPALWDISRYLAAHPWTNALNPWADNPYFQTQAAGTMWYWGQPAVGYYAANDPWVLRRNLALLTHAGVDVLIFDNSNGVTYDTALQALCSTLRQMRCEGFKTNLKLVFLTHANSPQTVTYEYNNFYALNQYPDLWFYWQGKPLILGYPTQNLVSVSATISNFFSWRTSWAYVATNALHDEWQWIDTPTPQNWGYDTRFDLPEELPVTCGGWASSNIGHSYTNNTEPAYNSYDLPVAGTQGQGLLFQEQMFYGLKYDPQFLFITGWNEWIAGVWFSPSAGAVSMLGQPCPANGFYFVDEYNEEYSRDIEPMQGGHTDNYYFQMVGQNRQYKGARPLPLTSPPQTINLAGDFTDWTNVAPTYYDPANDTLPRNFASAIVGQPALTNKTGRNDFTVLKVARDANYLYFLAQCNSNITSYSGSNWMVLFIDADQNHATGWKGYDFAVNLGGVGAATTTLCRNTTITNGWTWTPVRSDLPYSLSGHQLMLRLARADLGLGPDPIAFNFHWADNFQTNDIADFGVNGDSAPDGRFNYCYQTAPPQPLGLLADDFESGEQTWWGQSWTNGSRWGLTSATTYSSNHCAICNLTSGTGQSALTTIPTNTSSLDSLLVSFHYKLLNVSNAQNALVQYYSPTGWVTIRNLGRNQYYASGQSWSYDEVQDVWLRFTDARLNAGTNSQFFQTNFAFQITGSGLANTSQSICVDDFSLTGTAPSTAPYFITQPSSQTVTNGASVTFSATAAGQAPLSYQWLFNGTNLPAGGNISGATSNVLSIAAATISDSGNYSLIVTSSCGSATSSIAALTVVLPPVFPPIPNQTVIAGQTLVVTNTASDPAAPPQSLTFAALIAPTNSTVNPATGTFTWRLTIAQSPLVTWVQLEAQDNSPPPWSATQSFWVTVNRLVQPQLAGVAWTNGNFGLSVSGDSGPDYTIEGATNLVPSNVWATLLTTNSPAMPFWWTDPQTNLSQRFYRVLLGP